MSRPRRTVGLAALAMALCAGAGANAQNKIHTEFTFGTDSGGYVPNAVMGYHTPGQPLTWALYGSTFSGGAAPNHLGVVYKLTPPSPGSRAPWKQTILHDFTQFGDSASPLYRLTFDKAGAIYGVARGYPASEGGVSYSGSVFKLTPPAAGQTAWTFATLHNFTSDPGGNIEPTSSLTFDSAGALYGNAYSYGKLVFTGIVYKLAPPATPSGSWTYTALHSFPGVTSLPGQDVTMDHAGALYGTVSPSAAEPLLAYAYKLTPPPVAGASWGYQQLYSFSLEMNGVPSTSLILDRCGALYGATSGFVGGSTNYPGSIFKLNLPAKGATSWTKTILHIFPPISSDGGQTPIGLTASGGVLYGQTSDPTFSINGTHLSTTGGTIFRLTPPASGQGTWTETVLTAFPFGTEPTGNTFALDAIGNLYGSATNFITYSDTLFKLYTQPAAQ